MKLNLLSKHTLQNLAEVSRLKLSDLLLIKSAPKFVKKKILKKVKNLSTPIAYTRGFCYFFGHKFFVSPGIFIPRPESERMIEFVLEELKVISKTLRILDVCSGTGALGITLGLELQNKGSSFKLTLTDISKRAVNCICKNLQTFSLQASVFECNLFPKHVNYRYDLVLCNPPYLNLSDYRGSLKKEPKRALVSRFRGFKTTFKFLERLNNYLSREGFAVLESSEVLLPEILLACKHLGIRAEVIDSFLKICFLKLTLDR